MGPGKVRLLELVREEGSISGAARAMDMAYRHAWELIDDMNRCFREAVVETSAGGRRGGGARLTPFGEELVERFRRMEASARSAMEADLDRLEAATQGSG